MYNIVPSAVRDLMTDDDNDTAIKVSFLPPEHANGIILLYEIRYVVWENGSIVGNEISRILTAADFMQDARIMDVIPGLKAFTQYRVVVIANTSVGGGELEVVIVNTDPSAASPPVNFTISAYTSESVTLMWNYPEMPRGLIQGYVVRYSLSDVIDNSTEENVTLSIADDTSPQSYTVMGLQPFTSYQFTVRAYSFNNSFFVHQGNESETLIVRTDEAGNID